MFHLFLCQVSNGSLRGLSSKVDKLYQVLVVRYSNGALAAFLPLKHGVRTELEFKCRGDKATRWFIIHCFQSTKVLLYSIVQSTQLLSGTLLSEGASRIILTCVWWMRRGRS